MMSTISRLKKTGSMCEAVRSKDILFNLNVIRKIIGTCDTQEALQGNLFEDIHTESFVDYCTRHQISALLYHIIKRSGINCPEEIGVSFRRAAEDALVFFTFAQEVLSKLVNHYNGKVVFLKGAALLDNIYPDGWSRQMGDIDVYLPEVGSLVEFRALLMESGFKLWRNYENVWTRSGMTIDLHEFLWGEDRIRARSELVPDVKVSYLASQQIPGAYILAPRIQYYHSVYHCVKHGFSRHLWDFDLVYIRKKIREQDLSHSDPLVRADAYRRRFLSLPTETPVPEGFRKKALDWIFANPEHPGAGEIGLASLFPTRMGSTLYLVRSILPTNSVLREMYGNHIYPALLWKRIYAMLKMIRKLFSKS